ncbi:MAG: glycosyl hydrolase family 17 protein [Verrucomicrobiota bacterium]
MNGMTRLSPDAPHRTKSLVLLIAWAIFGAFPSDSLSEEALLKPFGGVCYGPFREGQQPGGTYPSEADIREDLSILSSLASVIRTYGTESILFNISEYCNDIGLGCYPGAWIGGDSTADWQQISNLVQIADQGFDTTKLLIVGNETVQFNRTSKTQLIAYIEHVKSNSVAPVATAENWYIWTDPEHNDLADSVDVIGMHCHPYWDGIAAGSAAQYVLDKYQAVTNAHPGKRVIVMETGWPTAGSSNGAAIPSIGNQRLFLAELDSIVRENNLDVFVFEYADEPWKSGEPNGVGSHWGLLDKDREMKDGLEHLLSRHTRFLDISHEHVWLRTYEGNHYTLFSCTNLLSPDWVVVTNFEGVDATNKTQIPIDQAIDDKKCAVFMSIIDL